MFLVVVDAKTKWMDVRIINSITSTYQDHRAVEEHFLHSRTSTEGRDRQQAHVH
jgi:transcription elongation factor GreA-like protein